MEVNGYTIEPGAGLFRANLEGAMASRANLTVVAACDILTVVANRPGVNDAPNAETA
ncbi:MAG: hypothetical protein VX488_08715 [Actinomycetota bacterium]|nr:hypothetical protein [Actinomycetota bacterium]